MGAQIPIQSTSASPSVTPTRPDSLAAGAVHATEPLAMGKAKSAGNLDSAQDMPQGSNDASASASDLANLSRNAVLRGVREGDLDAGEEPLQGLNLSAACARMPVSLSV